MNKEVYRCKDDALVGRICRSAKGWRFISVDHSRKPGKRAHRCQQDAVPRWVGPYYLLEPYPTEIEPST